VLVGNAIRRVGVSTDIEGCEMDHVVASFRDSTKMCIPVFWILAHEFGDCREQGKGIERQWRAIDFEIGANIDVERLSSRWFRCTFWCRDRVWRKRCVSCVEVKGTGAVYWNIDVDGTIEIGFQPMYLLDDISKKIGD
jgi:hypothetical protein